MKTFVLLLLFTIITLSGTASPNLRFLRSIPNRTPRTSIIQSKTDIPNDIIQSDYKKPDQEQTDKENSSEKVINERAISEAVLKCINELFGNNNASIIWNKINAIVEEGDDDIYEQAYHLCDDINVDIRTNCTNCIKDVVDFLN